MFSSPTSVTMRWTTPMCVMRRDLTSPGQSMGNSATSPWETATSASSGQGKNQSIVGPETNPGNFLGWFSRSKGTVRNFDFFRSITIAPCVVDFSFD